MSDENAGKPGQPSPHTSASPGSSDWSSVVDDLSSPQHPGDSLDVPLELVSNPSSHQSEDLYKYKTGPVGLEPQPEQPEATQFRGERPRLTLAQPGMPASTAQKKALATPVEKALPDGLFAEEQSKASKRISSASLDSSGGLSSKHKTALAVGAGIVALGLAASFLIGGSSGPAPVPGAGTLSIVSDPAGATVIIDGTITEFKTPYETPAYKPGQEVMVSLQKAGFRLKPSERMVSVTGEAFQTVHFDLVPVRRVRIVTEPPGADIILNGKSLPGLTPMKLPALDVGSKAKIVVDLEGHLPHRMELSVDKTSDPEPIKLIASRLLQVTSTPPGAEITIAGVKQGLTPQYDLRVPEGQRFLLQLSKPGFRRLSKRLTIRKDLTLDYTLKEQSLKSLPLSRDERKQLRSLQNALRRVQGRHHRAQSKLTRAETILEKTMNNPQALFGVRARAKRNADVAQQTFQEIEEQLIEAQEALENFRTDVLGRLQMDQ